MKCGQTDKTAQEFCCQDDFKETTIYFCLYTSKKYVERVNVTWYCDSVAFYEVFSYPYHFISRQLKVESLHREFPSFSGSFRRIYWKILASKDHESKEFIATGDSINGDYHHRGFILRQKSTYEILTCIFLRSEVCPTRSEPPGICSTGKTLPRLSFSEIVPSTQGEKYPGISNYGKKHHENRPCTSRRVHVDRSEETPFGLRHGDQRRRPPIENFSCLCFLTELSNYLRHGRPRWERKRTYRWANKAPKRQVMCCVVLAFEYLISWGFSKAWNLSSIICWALRLQSSVNRVWKFEK